MASLTETAYFARKGVNIAIIVFVGIIILRGVLLLTTSIWSQLFPKKLPPATCAFGPLPFPNAQNGVATPSALAVSSEVPDPPTLPATLPVYFIPDPTSSFGSFDKMKSQAQALSFTGDPKRLSGKTWQFTDSDNSLRTLEYDEVSGNFHLLYNFSSDLSLFNDKNFTSIDAVISQVTNLFGQVQNGGDFVKTATPSAVYLKLQNSSLITTTSLSNADAVAVTLNRGDINGAPIVSPNPNKGLISAVVSGSNDQKKKILEANYFLHDVDKENFATYPTITAAAAIDKAKSGRAIFASIPTPAPSTFTIQTITLGYLDPFPVQSYLQPVYVLSDQKGLVEYVPAVRPDCSK